MLSLVATPAFGQAAPPIKAEPKPAPNRSRRSRRARGCQPFRGRRCRCERPAKAASRRRGGQRAAGTRPAPRTGPPTVPPPAEPAGAAGRARSAADHDGRDRQGDRRPYKPKPAGHLVKFNLQDADLAELVNHISGLTGKRFIYGPKVRQIKATVVSPQPVTLAEAYQAFLSILEQNGMTVVPHGRFLKIVDSGGVVTMPAPIYARGAPVPKRTATSRACIGWRT